MKKISTLLTLLIALTFSGVSIAEDSGYVYRCRIFYDKLNIPNNVHIEFYKITTQSYHKEYCDRGRERLSAKIIEWMSVDTNNIVNGLSNELKCKRRGDWSWGTYHNCKPIYRERFIQDLKDVYPNQVHIPDIN
jgi:hypothetical protein